MWEELVAVEGGCLQYKEIHSFWLKVIFNSLK